MLTKKLGFIGCGNIAKAIIEGMILSNKVEESNIFIFDLNKKSVDFLKTRYSNIIILNDPEGIIEHSDLIFLCIKPHILNSVLDHFNKPKYIEDLKSGKKILISVCAGKSIADICAVFKDDSIFCIRTMPNLTLSICEGTWLYYENPSVDFNNSKFNPTNEIIQVLETCGRVYKINENIFSNCTVISGCGPGFVANIVQNMVNSSIEIGVPKELATNLILETIYGTSKLLLNTNNEQDSLAFQKKVSTPGGSTEAGINTLESNGIGQLFLNCFRSSLNKCIELGKN
ncbi:hypothetical protein FG386_001021 [Cryptosporidium ryanae]|uniref:uncharacterized protein n=1 Tax=Cryptosporidium ryanae TaxID=515981 RepID=UPI00351A78C6|nr:hypothetical protein FG386_001021 [Cryptosporidium ryanae]